MADQRTLRGISVASFLPAFFLCIIAGAETGDAVPAVGIIPHFFSSALGIAVLISLRQQRQQPKGIQPAPRGGGDGDEEAHIGSDDGDDGDPPRLKHSFLVFLADVILATSLLIVLVATWAQWHHNFWRGWADHVMLLTYATVPLILNACIHIILALQEFIDGTGIAGLLCFRARDCPHCGNHIDVAAAAAEAPLFATARPPPWLRGSGARIKLPDPSVMKVSSRTAHAAGWNAPPWAAVREQRDAVLRAQRDAVVRERYRDDGEGAGGPPGKGKAAAGEEGEGV
ncbi:hypothetical protein QBC39DRAFT_249600 [Podospora conica]|nr:hypothetical protein QBC39DRAFT_249600 [Schizothecium conicum]